MESMPCQSVVPVLTLLRGTAVVVEEGGLPLGL
jgi:hypothetical protein